MPKEFTSKEEDFQPWLKKTEAFFVSAIKESEIMLEWSAEQVTETTMEHEESELTPTTTNAKRCVPNVKCVLQQMHTALTALTSYEGNDIVANWRKNPVRSKAKTAETI